MKLTSSILILATAALLAGCETVREVKVPVEKIIYVSNPVPAAYTDKIYFPAPPDRAVYESLTCDLREAKLADYNKQLMKSLSNSNTDRASLRKWSDNQQKKNEVK